MSIRNYRSFSTSLSGLWERRLEIRTLCICLFSSCDLTSRSSSWMRFLLGLFMWWCGASLRAFLRTFLKRNYFPWSQREMTCHHWETWDQSQGEVWVIQLLRPLSGSYRRSDLATKLDFSHTLAARYHENLKLLVISLLSFHPGSKNSGVAGLWLCNFILKAQVRVLELGLLLGQLVPAVQVELVFLKGQALE